MRMIERRLSALEKRAFGSPTGPGSKFVRLTPDECRAINESLDRVRVAIARCDGRETLSPEDQLTFDIYTEFDAAC